ncbi:hypothetical protein Mgra_00007217 [Meloidogyne graminicola]|uniref:Uncharacterized protein n=1 Tax=Meloidogyne graminicola TaxID=189291 RepID=A0A8S9ZJ18_9BILA|nr:hypothetical protein Mgra_00008718 [Meloidogyne graminicola]KAF7633335.1 hypothetical protein Mgra_00007217 [Meloidogyne graminicola]
MKGKDYCYYKIIFVNNNCFVISFALLTVFMNCYAGPVNVRIETENNKNFHVGPEPRTRFELVEQYSPLATAKKVYQDSAPSRAFASSLSKTWQPIRPTINKQPVQVVVDFGKAGRDGIKEELTTSIPLIIGKGLGEEEETKIETISSSSQWLDWTKWGKCENGERIRTRKCIVINNIPCEKGQSIERQKCYSSQTNSGLKFAQDPIIIEREIRRELANPRK